MGYLLLWIENLVAALLLAAVLLSVAGRARPRRFSRALAVLAVLLPLAVYGVTLAFIRHLQLSKGQLSKHRKVSTVPQSVIINSCSAGRELSQVLQLP